MLQVTCSGEPGEMSALAIVEAVIRALLSRRIRDVAYVRAQEITSYGPLGIIVTVFPVECQNQRNGRH